MATKYITWDDGLNLNAIIFPNWFDHAQVALDNYIRRDQILGAGFCDFEYKSVRCFGKSESLKMSVNINDEKIIDKMFYKKCVKQIQRKKQRTAILPACIGAKVIFMMAFAMLWQIRQ